MVKEAHTWVIKDWTVYPQLHLIQNHRTEFTVKPRLMKLLEFFLLNNNEIVTREAILDYVWEDRIVTENLLTKSISELRKLLEEHFQDELQIETIRNVGYRFQASFDIVCRMKEAPNFAVLKNKKRGLAMTTLLSVCVVIFTALIVFFVAQQKAEYSSKTKIISSLKGQELSPVVSPNGKNLAFAWRENTTKPFNIYLRSLEESIPRKLTNRSGPEFNPAWSPDGNYLAFMSHKPSGELILVKKSIIGDDEVELANLRDYTIVRGMIWTKDGSLLIFSAKKEDDPAFRLYAYEISNALIRPLTTPPENAYGDLHPSFSDQKGIIAFVRASQGQSIFSSTAPTNSTILTLSLEKGFIRHVADLDYEIKELVHHNKLKQYLCWIAPQLGINQLWRIRPNGKKHLLRTSVGGMSGKGSIGKNDAFYFEYWQSRVNVLEYPLSSTNALTDSTSEYLNSTQWDWGLKFASQANTMAFISLRDGFQEIWLAPTDAPGSARQVTQFKSELMQSISLSPDGKKLLFLSMENQQPAIYFVQSNGQNLRKLSEDGADYSSPEWATDGKHFYYGSDKSGQWNLWKRNIEGTIDQIITKDGGHTAYPDPSQEGSLFFIKNKADTIWHLSRKNEVPKPVCATPGLESFNWVPRHDGIFYLAWNNGICNLYYYEFQNQKTHHLKPLEHILPSIPALAIPPDGQSIFIAQSNEVNADILSLEISHNFK